MTSWSSCFHTLTKIMLHNLADIAPCYNKRSVLPSWYKVRYKITDILRAIWLAVAHALLLPTARAKLLNDLYFIKEIENLSAVLCAVIKHLGICRNTRKVLGSTPLHVTLQYKVVCTSGRDLIYLARQTPYLGIYILWFQNSCEVCAMEFIACVQPLLTPPPTKCVFSWGRGWAVAAHRLWIQCSMWNSIWCVGMY
jgi:hypothetical protein